MYRCPGETYPIERPIHLGRLAAFYPPCRDCPHRADAAPLPRRTIAQWAAGDGSAGRTVAAFEEGLWGVYRNAFTPDLARNYAAALAMLLRELTRADAPAVVVAGDARPLAPELVAAACDGVRLAGCRAIDLGATTSAGVVCGLEAAGGEGGALLVGNPTGEPHVVGLEFWGPGARPLSWGHGLERLQDLAARPIARPVRRAGPLQRLNIDDRYQAGLRELFHALRPLRVVIDTGCLPLARYLRKLAAGVACELLAADRLPPPAGAAGDGLPRRRPPPLPCRPADSRLRWLGQQVCARAAHLGIWIDGNGETCQVVDERGAVVPGDRLLVVLARHVSSTEASTTVVLEDSAAADIAAALGSLGWQVVRGGSRRAELDAALRETGGALGGGASGRIFHAPASPPCPALPAADALRTLALLLGALSTSDRPLSEVAAPR